MKTLRVHFSDGKVYEIPAAPIANDRAGYFAVKVPHEDFVKVYEQEYQYTRESAPELIDWAKNNMEWEDLFPFAKLVTLPEFKPDYHSEWPGAETEVLD